MLAFRLLAVFLTLLIATPAAALSQSSYLCSMSGKRVFSCCCGKQKPNKAAAGHGGRTRILAQIVKRSASVDSPQCCKRSEPVQSAPGAVGKSNLDLPTAAVLLRHVHETQEQTIPDADFQAWISARAPPAIGPPLFIKYCALLN